MVLGEYFLWGAFAVLSLIATVIDARTYKIPNWIVAAIAIAGLVYAGAFDTNNFFTHVIISISFLALGFLLYQLIGLGAGDAKLLCAIGLWLQVSTLMTFLFLFGWACALLVLVLIIGRRVTDKHHETPKQQVTMFTKDAPVPLALAIGPAAMLVAVQQVLAL